MMNGERDAGYKPASALTRREREDKQETVRHAPGGLSRAKAVFSRANDEAPQGERRQAPPFPRIMNYEL
jgi:hypothetical protein